MFESVAQAGERLFALKCTRDRLKASEQEEREALGQCERELASIEEARQVTQTIAEELQQRAHIRIARVVSRCLEAVFDDPYEFQIQFEKKRGKTEAVLLFVRDGTTYDQPMDEVGGGVLDVASLALRLACVMIAKPPARRTFVLDEPWSNIRGKDNRERTRNMLYVLSEEFGVQWILNTDIESYRLGKILEMPSPEGS